MAKRDIIEIDENKCTGCGLCIPNCHEGALQIIDGKARLISDLFCDGLGACIGHCPEDAITIIKREAVLYNEKKTLEENIIPKGENTIKAHMTHLRDHGANDFLNEAIEYLKEKGIENPLEKDVKMENNTNNKKAKVFCGCPGSDEITFDKPKESNCNNEQSELQPSELQHWPVQLHLVSPQAPYFKENDVLLAADCVAFSIGDFHKNYLKGKSLAIACPKLDSNQEIYLDKLVSMINDTKINTLTVMIMEVPCCGGLLNLAQKAIEHATRKIPLKLLVVSIKGEIIKEKWV